jgi:hypothetical protein
VVVVMVEVVTAMVMFMVNKAEGASGWRNIHDRH